MNWPVMEYVCMCGFVRGSTGSCHRHVENPWRDGAPHPLSQGGWSSKPLLQAGVAVMCDTCHVKGGLVHWYTSSRSRCMAPVLAELDLRNTELEAAQKPHPQDVHSSQSSDVMVSRYLATMLAGDYERTLDTGGPEPTYDAHAELFPAIPLVPLPHVRQLYSASDHEAAISAVRHDAETSDEEDLGEQIWHVMQPTDVSWRSAWFEAGEEPLMDDQESCITVWAWAALCVSTFCAGFCTIEQLDASLVPRTWPDGRYPCHADNPLAPFPHPCGLVRPP